MAKKHERKIDSVTWEDLKAVNLEEQTPSTALSSTTKNSLRGRSPLLNQKTKDRLWVAYGITVLIIFGILVVDLFFNYGELTIDSMYWLAVKISQLL